MQPQTIGRSGIGLNDILFAGIAGGLAEVVWVSLYASVTPLAGAEVARQVTATVFGSLATGGYAVEAGILIHFVLSIAIAAAFALTVVPAVFRRGGASSIVAASMAVLATIWCVNFFVVLPVANPQFLELMPLSVTLASKLMFGIAQGAIFAQARRRNYRAAFLHR